MCFDAGAGAVPAEQQQQQQGPPPTAGWGRTGTGESRGGVWPPPERDPFLLKGLGRVASSNLAVGGEGDFGYKFHLGRGH
ncbi:hypothetical protein L249_5054 [Ophiocordyceps polyrhachis-furcata BCC 54312]|uniref:Uncharacterized protein n=1 Tax=Ophiocordyceps polyrhachis-furcata BCC 54312 TaxID=1330021 RepID=A0A367L3F6_9HYPO|nr:hypothetical protein L249_5054 [Ophiocordyceps polyrhachis-furcata BCC 54312]